MAVYTEGYTCIPENILPILPELEEKAKGSLARIKQVLAEQDSTAHEIAVLMPGDAASLNAVKQTAQALKGNVKHVFVVGIGGSNLGFEAVYAALPVDTSPLVSVLSNLDEAVLSGAIQLLTSCSTVDEFAIVLISKSGNTVETIAQSEILCAQAIQTFGDAARSRIVVITDSGSVFESEAQKQQFKILTIPASVGGRYSVFSAVGLLPLALVLDEKEIDAFIQGAQQSLDAPLQNTNTYPLTLAAQTYALYTAGYSILDLMVFAPKLQRLGLWQQQLLAESLGKAEDKQGREVHSGITPTVSIASAALHSVAQLYLAGPRNKQFRLIAAIENSDSAQIPTASERLFPNNASEISGHTLSEIRQSIFAGHIKALQDQHLPHTKITLSADRANSIGGYMMQAMIETMILADLMHVNAFDQPAVEAYKQHARANLLS